MLTLIRNPTMSGRAPQRGLALDQAARGLPGAQLVLQRQALGGLPAGQAQLAHAQHGRAQRQRPRAVAASGRQALCAALPRARRPSAERRGATGRCGGAPCVSWPPMRGSPVAKLITLLPAVSTSAAARPG